MDPKKFETRFFLILFLIVFGFVLLIFSPYFRVMALAAMVAVIFKPLNRRILSAMPRWEGAAALLSIIVVCIVILLPLVLFGFQIVRQAGTLYSALVAENFSSDVSTRIELFMRDRFFDPLLGMLPDGVRENITVPSLNINQYLGQLLGWIVEHAGSVFSGVAQITFSFFLWFMAMYYFFKDGEKLKQKIAGVIPLQAIYSEKIFDKLEIAVNSVVKGSLFVALIQGIVAGLGFLIFGVPNSVLWGSVAVFTALIPHVGTALVIVPAVIYLFIKGGTISAIGLLLWGFLVVGLIDNVVRQHLLGRGISIHPFLILLSVLGGIGFFGPVGFLLGPLALSLFFALLDIYPELILKEETHPH